MEIHSSIAEYEAFLRGELGPEVVEEGLKEKRKDMRDSAFSFLRGSFWRWAETIPGLAPELMDAPRVLAVGDIHLENFGTWRDADGRLVWGVNDFDEVAEMPYALDLVRLAASALLARLGAAAPAGLPDAVQIGAALVEGYRAGLVRPQACILDRDNAWLRGLVVVPESERTAFWDKLAKKRKKFEKLPAQERPVLWPRYRDALVAALPPGSEPAAFWYRSAGLGSLGRPRWVVEATWHGDLVLREAKGVVASGWLRAWGKGGRALRCMEIATGRHRAPDPWYRVVDGIAVRRLSPNNHKIDAEPPSKTPDHDGSEAGAIPLAKLLGTPMLEAMGRELAMLHAAHDGVAGTIAADLTRRPATWLAGAAARAAAAATADHAALAHS